MGPVLLNIQTTVIMFRVAIFAGLLCLGMASYEIKECMPNSVVKVNSATIAPHPIPLDKGFHINYDADLLEEIDGTIDVDVTFKKKVGFLWVTVPCISDVGSCTYEDICTLMEDEIDSGICSKLEALGLPCACPMDPKKYDMSVDVPPIDLGAIGIAVGGDYEMKVVIKKGRNKIGCVEAKISLE